MIRVGFAGVFVLGLSVVSGRATAQPAAPAPEPAVAQDGVPMGTPTAVPPAAAQPPAAAPPTAAPPAAAPPFTPSPAPQQGGYPPPPAGRWMPKPDGTYSWVPAGYELPPVLPYREGQPVPQGYHVEERVARGPLVTGFILTGVAYTIGVIAATTSNFVNSSAYLLLPWVGPWLTLGLRRNACETSEDPGECALDAGVSMGLVFDGIVQGVGGVLILASYLAPRQKLILDDPALSLKVTRVGTGYGLGASGTF